MGFTTFRSMFTPLYVSVSFWKNKVKKKKKKTDEYCIDPFMRISSARVGNCDVGLNINNKSNGCKDQQNLIWKKIFSQYCKRNVHTLQQNRT